MHTIEATKTSSRAILFALLFLSGVMALVGCGGGGSGAGSGGGSGGGSGATASTAAPTILSESGSQSARVGEAVTFSVVADAAQGYQWQGKAAGAWADVSGATAPSHTVANLTLAMDGARYRVVVLGAGGSVISSEFAVTVGESLAAPTITTQPSDVSVTVGQSATLTVVANATTPRFAWQVSVDGGTNWAAISSATTDTLQLPNLALADNSKRYRVIVSNPAGVVTSAAALLTVTEKVVAPAIATQPDGRSANPGQDVSFTVGAVGSNLAYQWQSRDKGGASWAPVAGGNGATLDVKQVSLGDNGKAFKVIVSNSEGSLPSNEALLSVTEAVIAPTITEQPKDQEASEGQSPSMLVVATGTAPSYLWQMSSDNGATWTNVSGGTAATLLLNNVVLADNGKRYRVIVSNSAGTAPASNSARLTVKAAVVPPAITIQPIGANRVVGQSATVSVKATGTALSYAWEERSDPANDVWTPLAGETNDSLTLNNLSILQNLRRYRVKVSNSAGQTVVSNQAVINVAWGSVTTSDDLSTLDTVYGGGGDGGSPGGGDGAGADGGGGLGKTLNAEFTVTRISDGALVGRAPTHKEAGLVKIKAGPGAAPLLLTLRGNARATYYDEGKAALGQPTAVPFPEGAVLHALVDQIDENLGVTPLTEAAYRYAINHFLVDPAEVAAGKVPLRATATDKELQKLTKAQIQAAHKAVLDAVNRTLPASYRMVSLKSLPTPVDERSSATALSQNRYGIAQVVTGGLVAAVGQFNPDLADPGLTSVEQFARDMTDGRLDGLALDGSPMSGDKDAAYDSLRFPTAVNVGANLQAKRFGTSILEKASPFVEVAEYTHVTDRAIDKITCDIAYVALRSDGLVSRNLSGGQTAPGTRCPADGPITAKNPDWGSTARELQPDVFIVSNTGALFGVGSAACGRLGNVSEDSYEKPASISALKDVTAIIAGSANSVARNSKGQVFTFGKDVDGSLGVGTDVAGKLPLCEGRPSTRDPLALPQLAKTVSLFKGGDTTFFAVAADGALLGWGSGGQGQFGVLEAPRSPDRPAPLLVAGIKAVRAVAATATSVHALTADGNVWGWGLNTNGEFGDGSTTPKPKPTLLKLGNITQIASNQNNFVYALDEDGKVWRWGNCIAPLCDKATPMLPTVMPKLPAIRNLSPGTNRVFALSADGQVFGLYPAAMEAVDLTDQFK
jgi:Regulator of chromosome condensation (RCC1) repeat